MTAYSVLILTALGQGYPAHFAWHILNAEDLTIRKHILNLACNFETSWEEEAGRFTDLPETLMHLKELKCDGLVKFGHKSLKVTEGEKTLYVMSASPLICAYSAINPRPKCSQ